MHLSRLDKSESPLRGLFAPQIFPIGFGFDNLSIVHSAEKPLLKHIDRLNLVGMQFSRLDFDENINNWKLIVDKLPRLNPISYLELGVYEGRSLFWVLENLFQHPNDRAVAVDRFHNSAKERFFHNLDRSSRKSQVRILEESFRPALIKLESEQEQFDLIYEDGTHIPSETMETLCLAWPMLKVNGILIVDDYEWNRGLPSEFSNSLAVDCFVKMHKQEIEVLDWGRQVVLRKVPSKRSNLDSVELGNWIYRWFDGILFHTPTGRELTLDPMEKEWLQRCFFHGKWRTTLDKIDFDRKCAVDRKLQRFLEEKEKLILSN